jgi:membrane protein
MPVKRTSLWRADAKSLLLLTWRQFQEDNCTLIAAGLAFYALFSLVPVLLLLWLGAGRIFGYEASQGLLTPQLTQVMGADLAVAVQSMVQAASAQRAGALSVASLAILIWSSVSAFRQLQRALNFIWGVGPRKGVKGGILSLLWAFATVLGIALLYLGFAISHFALGFIRGFVNPWAPLLDELLIWSGLHLVALFLLMWWLWSLVFRFLPSVRLAWREVRVGGMVTAFLLTIGMYALGSFFRVIHSWTAFGAAASVVAVLIWLYFSSQIFLLGAEFTWAFATLHGTLRPKPMDHPLLPPGGKA